MNASLTTTFPQRSLPTRRKTTSLSMLKKGVWLYFLLLIFEGALRKWFLTPLSTPLLVVRDPVAVWIILEALKQRKFPFNPYVPFTVLIAVTGIYTAFFLGHGNVYIAVYGARALLFHFPLVFAIGQIMDRSDVERIGRFTVMLTPFMALLIAMQFFSPQSAWVNRGIDGSSSSAGFSGALGFFRPPATFSFTNGTSMFFSFAACFIIYFWLSPTKIRRLTLLAATVGLLAAIPLSISRGLFFSVLVSVGFALLATSRKPGYLWRLILGMAGIGVLYLLLGNTSFFQTATRAFSTRFSIANQMVGGVDNLLLDFYLGGLVSALTQSSAQPFFGYGIGLGTNAGAIFMSGNKGFVLSEGEWGRLIGELGPVMGLALVFMRLSLSATLAVRSYNRLSRGDLLPWMLLSFGLLTVPQGGWAQPTSLGFCTVIAGLILAACRVPKKTKRPARGMTVPNSSTPIRLR
ncbi:MAG TPA: hypothetical protein VGD92_13710 [Sphingobacteriaceae bacterium]